MLTSDVTAATHTDVYLFGGQSNMTEGVVDGFRYEMGNLDPSTVLVTPHYRNPGIGLDPGWNENTWLGDPPGPGRINFYPGTNASDPNIGKAYRAMVRTWQHALSCIEGPCRIKGILWVQGEQDAKESIAANRYAAGLHHVITRIHTDLGLAPAPVPFFYSSMESTAERFTCRTTLRAQQDAADQNYASGAQVRGCAGHPECQPGGCVRAHHDR